mgnify:CR=1 FL=1
MGRKVDGLKKALKNITAKDVVGETIGEVYDNFNLQYENIVLTVTVKDELDEAIASPTITLKTGATQDSGDAVSAEADGTYVVKYGKYNIAVAKTGYVTKKAILDFGYTEAVAKAATYAVELAQVEG